jgi:hypothetical protein
MSLQEKKQAKSFKSELEVKIRTYMIALIMSSISEEL